MNFQNILYATNKQIATITLNNPKKRNPINIDVYMELKQAFDLADYDNNIRLLVIKGAGGYFSAGGDLNAMKKRIDANILGTQKVCRIGAETILRLRNVKKPVIACIEGAIAGAGIALALACDFQIITETCKCVFAFVNIGFVPDSGAVYLVTRAIGTTKANDLFMSGRRFTGKEGVSWGLFTEAVEEQALHKRLNAYIEKYSNGPTIAYAGIKEMLNRAQFSAWADGMQAEIDCQGRCELTADYKEAVNAFLEKRKPQFTGK